MKKSFLILLIKLLVSAGLLTFFFTRIHIERFARTLAAADTYDIAVALLVYLISQMVSTVRWTILVRPLGFRTPY
ncbi:MAG TPA: lysylphosphatidylglycerol synthase domain-containing protein, partial [Terriglobales bacterium]|nr:lysylphosphatidylglycerol synthase domain-containing protein [Terriglobales bacterium]